MIRYRFWAGVCAVFLLLAATGCVNQHPDGENAVQGDALRIAATSPAVVEIMEKLGVDLVGVPDGDLSGTPARYAQATKTGAAMSPDLEILKSLHPDYVLSPSTLINDLQPKYDMAGLNYLFLNLKSVPGMYKSIEELGERLDRQAQAEALTREFSVFYNDYLQRHEGLVRPRVLILMGLPGSYVVATENSYAGSLVDLAGGINVYAGTEEEFLSVNPEDMRQKDPDIILRTAHALPEQVAEMFAKEFTENDIWKHFRAVQLGRVYDLNAARFGMSAKFNYPEALAELEPILYES
ncbi:MAG: heme ABC transporter substrate-binding protein IsdE [Peptococcaceae bacterium]|jgi:iron complex transport system substrate-binding protein|nr:heme ABC transporter substrate-binding protein IsdE [Peptococcaceae bacterium]